MNCSGGISGDDFDVDIETITDTASSVEIPGYSIQNISSASALISTERLVKFQSFTARINIPIPIVRSHRIKTMPSGKSGKISDSQALSLKLQTEHSAARCVFILGHEQKLLSGKKFTKVQSQPNNTQVHNRARCHISVATSAATAVRSTQLARRTYRRNPAVRAIDKEGSYQHYLHRKIKRLISTMATYAQNIDREIRLYHFAVDSYSSDFDHGFTLLKSKVGSNDYESQVKLLTSKIILHNRDFIRRNDVINSTMKLYADDLVKKIMLLNSKIASYAHDFGMHITLMNSKIISYAVDLHRKKSILKSKLSLICKHVRREYGPFLFVH